MNRILVISLYLVSRLAIAHEGHSMPGALPPAPHGGVVAEAADAEDHDHHDEHEKHEQHGKEESHAAHSEEKELFFEAVFKDKLIKIYPLGLSEQNTNIFSKISLKELNEVNLKVEIPRQKRVEILKFKSTDEALEAPFDAKGITRFIIHVATHYDKEEKQSKLQVEVD